MDSHTNRKRRRPPADLLMLERMAARGIVKQPYSGAYEIGWTHKAAGMPDEAETFRDLTLRECYRRGREDWPAPKTRRVSRQYV